MQNKRKNFIFYMASIFLILTGYIYDSQWLVATGTFIISIIICFFRGTFISQTNVTIAATASLVPLIILCIQDIDKYSNFYLGLLSFWLFINIIGLFFIKKRKESGNR